MAEFTGTSDNDSLTGTSGVDTLWGYEGDDTLDGGAGADTLYGSFGDDTYVVDDVGDAVFEYSGEGDHDLTRASVSWTLTDAVERLELTGSANINGTGNGLANTITGNSGANTLDGGAGADTLIGGTGNDVYIVDNSDDQVVELSGAGTDEIQTDNSFSLYNMGRVYQGLDSGYTGTIFTYVEIVRLSGSNDATLIGDSGINTLYGNDGANVIDGGAGADVMSGGAGNDTYYVSVLSDSVVESEGGGTDIVYASANFTLGANVEILRLVDGAGNINGTGNSGDNTIIGNDGANTLTGGGGVDSLVGGLGADVFVVDSTTDSAIEESQEDPGSVRDRVESSVTWTLGANIEDLTLTGSASVNATGNDLDNTLIGNSGANLLDGGTGADAMSGGSGNDTYIVDNEGDKLYYGTSSGTETSTGGIDLVMSSVSFDLSDSRYANLENLTLTGSSDITATGNALVNTLTGNGGSNTLDGKAGADSMIGGAGDDVYIVNDASDTVTEFSGGGTDTVEATVSSTLSFSLVNFDYVENLTLKTGKSATGNELDNILIANSAANTLDGKGGADTMSGMGGNDTYVVDNAGDVVSEYDGDGNDAGGTDLVQATASITLADFVENLTLNGTAAINGTGNDLANSITGNSGANSLNGGGGSDTLTGNGGDDLLDGGEGNDTLIGGAGDDTYYVDSLSDTVTESSSNGTDTVIATVSLDDQDAPQTVVLGTNVENLTLAGDAKSNATGNSLVNVLTGNGSENTLNGGSGADTMIGGAGDDLFIVDNVGDVASENEDEGVDTVQSSRTFTLGANIEALELTGALVINGTGNSGDNTITGNAAANTLDGGEGADVLAGGAGDDVYIVDNPIDSVSEADGEGTDTVQASVDWTLGDYLENLTLTGSDAINGEGNAAANILTGNSGLNTLTGWGGNDTYVVQNADAIVEDEGAGTDLVQAAVSWELGDNLENLTLTGSGNLNATGNAQANTLTGNSGANTLDGGGGADSLVGGAGNDAYVISQTSDVVVEAAGGGTDTAYVAVSWTVAVNVEAVVVQGTADLDLTGNSAANALTGNSGDNILKGEGGNDTLRGGGGSDTLNGGAGDDLFILSTASDVIVEAANQGMDTVQSGFSYTLGTNLEALTLTGSGNLSATGNTLANSLTGNTGANTLNGLAGNDTMSGGAGNDTYIVDANGDKVVESAGQGTDTVQASITYTLAANVENLTLTGSANLRGTGNTLTNVLTGNAGANTLDGGAGNDTLSGGAGNDVYVVDAAGDKVVESANQGTDQVLSSVTYTLAATLEKLTLTGKAAINATGNAVANVLVGNGGNNTLVGGAGLDTLTGGAGADVFRIGTTKEGQDTVTDFSASAGDKLAFVSTQFGKLTKGKLKSGVFVANTTGKATAAGQLFVFNTKTGVLSYDADGSGKTAAVAVVKLNVKSLTADAITIV